VSRPPSSVTPVLLSNPSMAIQPTPRAFTTPAGRTGGARSALTFLPLALAFLATLGAQPASAQKEDKDTIVMRDGKTTSAKIDSEDYTGLVVKGQPPIPYDTILSIEYSGAPEYSKAMEALTTSNVDDALNQLKELKADTKQRKVVRQQVLYQIGVAQERLGDLDSAIASYKELLKAFPKGRYLRAAATAMVDCYIGKKDFDGASKAIDAVQADAQAANIEGGFVGEVNVLKGNLFRSQGNKWADAKVAFTNGAAAAGAPKSVVQEAQLGLADCLLHEGKRDEAEAKYRELVNAEQPKPSNHVLAGAWNGIGEILLEQGKQKRDIDQLLDAVYSYLRGSTIYAPTAGEPRGEYQRALEGSAQCFKLISELEQNPERKRMWKDHHQDHLDKLSREFPNNSAPAGPEKSPEKKP
jgi:tetratricopeptide (TPR) repeat protein